MLRYVCCDKTEAMGDRYGKGRGGHTQTYTRTVLAQLVPNNMFQRDTAPMTAERTEGIYYYCLNNFISDNK